MLGRVENGATKGHWAGQRGHTALTRGIREELRDSLRRWFQDKQQPSQTGKTQQPMRPSVSFLLTFEVL